MSSAQSQSKERWLIRSIICVATANVMTEMDLTNPHDCSAPNGTSIAMIMGAEFSSVIKDVIRNDRIRENIQSMIHRMSEHPDDFDEVEWLDSKSRSLVKEYFDDLFAHLS